MMILHYKRKNEYLLAVLDQNGCKGTMAKMTPFGPVHARGGEGGAIRGAHVVEHIDAGSRAGAGTPGV